MSMKQPHQKRKRNNPVVEKMLLEKRIKEAMDSSKKAGIEFAGIAYNIISVMVLYDKLGLTDEQIASYMQHITKLSESINEDYVDLPDMIKTIKEEHDINISDDLLMKYYPELEGYLKPSET